MTNEQISSFNTINVTDMSVMFATSGLTSINLSNFDTSNVTNMHEMFDTCRNLTSLDLSSFDTSNVTSMSYMFRDCSSLTLDCSGWNVSKVTSYSNFNANAPNVTPPTWVN